MHRLQKSAVLYLNFHTSKATDTLTHRYLTTVRNCQPNAGPQLQEYYKNITTHVTGTLNAGSMCVVHVCDVI